MTQPGPHAPTPAFPTRRSIIDSATSSPAPPPSASAPRKRRSPLSMFVGFIGELLITAGVFLLLFIVWQLWWTTFELEGKVNAEIGTFQDEFPVVGDGYTDVQRTDEPPSVGDIPYGEIYGLLHVPRWSFRVMPIAQGVGPDVLNNGWAGHYPETQQAGEIGNFALAAHRRTYMNNFRRIDTLEDGDPIVVETEEAWLVYEVYGREIVDPSAVRVILPVPNEPTAVPTKRIMTMTTCHPEFGNTERFIVWSEMKYWVPKSEGIPEILRGEPIGGGHDGT